MDRMEDVEATMGFEPMNRGFADLRVEPLHHVARKRFARLAGADGCPSRIRTSVHGSKVRCPTTRRRGSGAFGGRRCGAEDGTRTRDPHLGKVMLYQLSHFRSEIVHLERWCRGPGSNWRHRDFQSRALPTELPRPDGQPRLAARRRSAGYHGPSRPCHDRTGVEASPTPGRPGRPLPRSPAADRRSAGAAG
jgi:2-polyprenyl-6-methoxyphenol hydroxylase-like FAD-dependent oxidoreductase